MTSEETRKGIRLESSVSGRELMSPCYQNRNKLTKELGHRVREPKYIVLLSTLLSHKRPTFIHIAHIVLYQHPMNVMLSLVNRHDPLHARGTPRFCYRNRYGRVHRSLSKRGYTSIIISEYGDSEIIIIAKYCSINLPSEGTWYAAILRREKFGTMRNPALSYSPTPLTEQSNKEPRSPPRFHEYKQLIPQISIFTWQLHTF